MQKPPEQQQYPQTNANVTPDGVIINILLAPNVQITTGLNNDMIDDIYHKSKETRKQAKQNLEIVRNMDVVRNINSKR
jgi:hypothetical protein